ncbi:hypothetical protein GCM10009678_86590 [Actinomadura kijaniata]|uniref:Uncharacterized protein n=1 Tax=Actinomadura namibiensis TaxID=182080 RepID=A0A7W3M0F9_ACTNM|nr:hypothetical protein [Actinomadura namibiensis]MBA8957724.1 hypothetical protein [Actinomadura namibiensis]
MTAAPTSRTPEETRHETRYWRIRTRLEVVRLGLWAALQAVWEMIHRS